MDALPPHDSPTRVVDQSQASRECSGWRPGKQVAEVGSESPVLRVPTGKRAQNTAFYLFSPISQITIFVSGRSLAHT